MTTDTDERRLDAEFEAHLRGGEAKLWRGLLVAGRRVDTWGIATPDRPLGTALDITTAEGREQAMELLKLSVVYEAGDPDVGVPPVWECSVLKPDGIYSERLAWGGHLPEAIIAAWRSARDTWRESNG